jgi:hypothetical protein
LAVRVVVHAALFSCILLKCPSENILNPLNRL